MKTKIHQFFLLVLIMILVLQACKKDQNKVEEPPQPQETPELLTSMVLLFKDSANLNNILRTEFRDPDGPGGKPAIQFDTINLKMNKTYFLNIVLLDETKIPFDTVSKEVWAKRNEHQLFFSHNNVNISTTYLDVDDKNLPVGLSSKWKTGAVSKGYSKIILKHQPNVKNGNITIGETDIEVTFQSKINI